MATCSIPPGSSRGEKHSRIVDELRRRIVSGEIEPGARLPQFSDLRSEFGVAINTINRALFVLEQERLIVREPGRGVYAAPKTKRPLHGSVGCINFTDLDGAHSDYWFKIFRGLTEGAAALGLDLRLLSPVAPVPSGLDGILVFGGWLDGVSPQSIAGIPAVSVADIHVDMPCARADEFSGALMATTHLTDLGHRRIGFLVDRSCFVNTIGRRIEGYRAGLRDAGIEPQESWLGNLQIDGVPFLERGQSSMAAWLGDGWKESGCTALLVQNDHAAIGAIGSLQAAGYKVPDDVSVVGFDGSMEGALISPPLTSVGFPLPEIGRAAVESLWARMQDQTVEDKVFPVSLTVRGSTAPVKK